MNRLFATRLASVLAVSALALAGCNKADTTFDAKVHDYLMRHPEVMQCYFVSGDADYLVVVSVGDMAQYNEFARRVFANEPNIRMFRSSFCLARVKYDTKIPVG